MSQETKLVIARAKQIYQHHKEDLEADHQGRYVAIEPESGDLFMGESFDAAVSAARLEYPSRLTHVIRIGHATAFHIGLIQR